MGADGSSISRRSAYTNIDSRDEIREVLAEAHGVDTDDIVMDTDADRNERLSRAGQAGKMAVAFSSKSWNSSWEPSGGNPNLN